MGRCSSVTCNDAARTRLFGLPNMMQDRSKQEGELGKGVEGVEGAEGSAGEDETKRWRQAESSAASILIP